MKFRPIIFLFLFVFSGCISRRDEAADLVHDANWQWDILPAGTFDLAAAWAPERHGNILWIYMEGDGLAYLTPSWPSSDPTPRDPIALRLALLHPGTVPVAYVARPCQYVFAGHDRACKTNYWTESRYAPEVIDSVGKAVDILKTKTGATRVIFVGYSGGGAVALLVAAKRHDVAGIVTIVADLDTAYWTQRDGLTPLEGSLNPASAVNATARIPQVHFTGGKDNVVGTDVARAFRRRMPAEAPVHIVEIPDFTHTCCWARDWPSLIAAPGVQSIFPVAQ